jgi:hypothetical protein
MSLEMDAGAGRPRAPFNATHVEAETTVAEPIAEGWLMLLTALTGVLAASSIGVCVFLR